MEILPRTKGGNPRYHLPMRLHPPSEVGLSLAGELSRPHASRRAFRSSSQASWDEFTLAPRPGAPAVRCLWSDSLVASQARPS